MLAWLAFETFSAGELFIPETRLAQLITDFWREWLQQEAAEQKELYGELNWRELPPKNVDAKKVIREIVVQQGLLVEQLPNIYSFSHLTFQEFFTAHYIVKNVAQDTLPRL
ncbi:MAG: hypothetical protein GY805_27795, partial [Chloroflexi bacterium]|nr:hypothetical protein [Chloroflexota bacterium]